MKKRGQDTAGQEAGGAALVYDDDCAAEECEHCQCVNGPWKG